MIVRESDEYFTMTGQHDHAILSGQIASHFKPEWFGDPAWTDKVVLAIREHDRGWIGLDEIPIWNDGSNAPFSFMDYPLAPKLPMYEKGIDEVERMNPYAALLCSLHYASFDPIRSSDRPDCIDYIRKETIRQDRIRQRVGALDPDWVLRHLRLLQFCDHLSLYVCLNKEGAAKEEEHPWFKDGLGTKLNDRTYTARWLSPTEIAVDPFPFRDRFQTTLRTKHVLKSERQQKGIALAYRDTAFSEQEISFVSR